MTAEAISGQGVLVVDDDEVMRELLEALLAFEGRAVSSVSSGEEAQAWLLSCCPEVILTDLQMPELHGDRLVFALRSASPSTLLIGMSATEPDSTLLDHLDAFVLKPFGALQLEQAIALAQERRAQQAALVAAGHPATLPVSPEQAPASIDPDQAPVIDSAIYAAMSRKFRPAQLAELYTMTLDDVGKRFLAMQAFADDGNLPAVQREAHTIKGLCGMFGARELQALAAILEGGTTLNTSALAEIPLACERLRRMLNAQLPQ